MNFPVRHSSAHRIATALQFFSWFVVIPDGRIDPLFIDTSCSPCGVETRHMQADQRICDSRREQNAGMQDRAVTGTDCHESIPQSNVLRIVGKLLQGFFLSSLHVAFVFN